MESLIYSLEVILCLLILCFFMHFTYAVYQEERNREKEVARKKKKKNKSEKRNK